MHSCRRRRCRRRRRRCRRLYHPQVRTFRSCFAVPQPKSFLGPLAVFVFKGCICIFYPKDVTRVLCPNTQNHVGFLVKASFSFFADEESILPILPSHRKIDNGHGHAQTFHSRVSPGIAACIFPLANAKRYTPCYQCDE